VKATSYRIEAPPSRREPFEKSEAAVAAPPLSHPGRHAVPDTLDQFTKVPFEIARVIPYLKIPHQRSGNMDCVFFGCSLAL